MLSRQNSLYSRVPTRRLSLRLSGTLDGGPRRLPRLAECRARTERRKLETCGSLQHLGLCVCQQ